MLADKLPAEIVCEAVDYDPLSGLFVWKWRPLSHFTSAVQCQTFNRRYHGRQALATLAPKGYRAGMISGFNLMAHRAAFCLVTGAWPSDQVDHINGNTGDNRWANLRCVSNAENHKNMRKPANNTSGRVGVYRASSGRDWNAKIKVNRRIIHLGTFSTFAEACVAREKAERELGFHPNHGRAPA